MATEELNPAGDNAHGDELPPRMPIVPGAQKPAPVGDPNGDASWIAAQAQGLFPNPTHTGVPYADMTHNPPGVGTHASHPYDTYKHEGCE